MSQVNDNSHAPKEASLDMDALENCKGNNSVATKLNDTNNQKDPMATNFNNNNYEQSVQNEQNVHEDNDNVSDFHSSSQNSPSLQESIAGNGIMLKPLSKHQLQEIELIYNASKTSNKILKVTHLEAILHLIGLCPSTEEMNQFYKMIGDNSISLSELIEIVSFSLLSRWSRNQVIRQAMRCFYLLSDRSFHVPIDRLRIVLCGNQRSNSTNLDTWYKKYRTSAGIQHQSPLSERDFDILLYEKQLSMHTKIGLDDFLRLLAIDTTTSPPLLGI